MLVQIRNKYSNDIMHEIAVDDNLERPRALRQAISTILSDDNHLVAANLSGADLSGLDMSGSNLSGSDLSGANLSGSNLSGCDLRNTIFSTSEMTHCNLSNCKMQGSRLRRSNLSNSNLDGADMEGANIRWADLSGCDMSNAYLAYTYGMNRYVKHFDAVRYSITYTESHVYMSCMKFTNEKLLTIDDKTIVELAGEDALSDWKEFREKIIGFMKDFPAEPTGERAKKIPKRMK